LQPENPITRFNLATTLFQLGKTNDAMAQFNEALRRAPDNAGFHAQFARVLLAQGRRNEAVAQLREALRLSPGDAEVTTQLRALGVPLP
jgi:Flp pilus assembly protein TadD